jgi:hypothetical protein
MRFREADVLVVPVALVPTIAAAGTEERKKIADEIVVEIPDIPSVEGVPVGDEVVEPRGELVGPYSVRPDGSLKIFTGSLLVGAGTSARTPLRWG